MIGASDGSKKTGATITAVLLLMIKNTASPYIRTLNYGTYGISLIIMGNAGFISSTYRVPFELHLEDTPKDASKPGAPKLKPLRSPTKTLLLYYKP